MEKRIYSFEPIYNSESKVLILGSMASIKSLEYGFYYMHPQNKFWKVIAMITGEDVPPTHEGKKELLLRHNIAVMDVLDSCERDGSLDSNIKNYIVNDVKRVVENTNVVKIFNNGKYSYNTAKKHFPDLEFNYLPSTSPANNGSFDVGKWLEIKNYL